MLTSVVIISDGIVSISSILYEFTRNGYMQLAYNLSVNENRKIIKDNAMIKILELRITLFSVSQREQVLLVSFIAGV